MAAALVCSISSNREAETTGDEITIAGGEQLPVPGRGIATATETAAAIGSNGEGQEGIYMFSSTEEIGGDDAIKGPATEGQTIRCPPQHQDAKRRLLLLCKMHARPTYRRCIYRQYR